MKYLVGRSLLNPPYLEIVEVENDIPGQSLEMVPPLFAPAEKLRFPRDNSQMMVATKFRREFVQGIGNPTEVVPTEGLRLIAPNDAFVLFGGTATIDPVLYQRRGPGYERWGIAIPTGEYVITAAFSASSRYLFVVTSDDDTEVKVLRRESTGFVQIHAIDLAFAVVNVSVTAGDAYVIIEGASVFVAHQNLDSQSTPYPAIPTTPVGKLMAISPDNRWYVMDMGGSASDLTVYEHSTGTWTALLDLDDTDGNNRKAAFSPDGTVLEVSFARAGSNYSPAFFSVQEGTFAAAAGQLRTNAGNRDYRGVKFSPDSEYMLHAWRDGTGVSTAELFGKTLLPTPPLQSHINPFPRAFAAVAAGAFSPNGQHFLCGSANVSSVFLYDIVGDTFEEPLRAPSHSVWLVPV
ncbi:hypothetical protein [Neoaquamicrobium sediminum]|uniref:hypothetical protein n=1 Tax=Neoaquamicrobium sediminum TaxID=1849104 RepID=UPI001565844D|nr:hypothetical protein [Mesorhizobium sediminum]NRC54137.1 hypothetical protein [Mesorhizobium sediminum]